MRLSGSAALMMRAAVRGVRRISRSRSTASAARTARPTCRRRTVRRGSRRALRAAGRPRQLAPGRGVGLAGEQPPEDDAVAAQQRPRLHLDGGLRRATDRSVRLLRRSRRPGRQGPAAGDAVAMRPCRRPPDARTIVAQAAEAVRRDETGGDSSASAVAQSRFVEVARGQSGRAERCAAGAQRAVSTWRARSAVTLRCRRGRSRPPGRANGAPATRRRARAGTARRRRADQLVAFAAEQERRPSRPRR